MSKDSIGKCRECFDDIFKTEEYTRDRAASGGISLMHIDCCPHHNLDGNYEDVWCKDCGADYNNGRLR
jgi:hypothetical protein